MGKASRDKGARGEREFAALCREHGYDAQRTAQYKGKNGGEPDVIGLPGIHVEVKRVERLNLQDAMSQAIADAKDGTAPIVASKRNNCPWMITMLAEDWFEIYREYEAGRKGTSHESS